MRLSWFAPAVGPAARGAAAVLPALRRQAEVVVCGDPAGEVAWAEVNRADAAVYHLDADDPGDSPIAQCLRQHPGIVVLHDRAPTAAGAAPVPLLSWPAELAAGVLVHSWPGYVLLRGHTCCPVLYRPAPGAAGDADAYARDLLHLAARARQRGPVILSLRLARQAGVEMSAWMSGLADEQPYRRVAEAIRVLVA